MRETHRKSNRYSGRIWIGIGGMLFVMIGSGMTMLVTGWESCWSEFRTNAALCCNIGSPEAVAACLNGEAASLTTCLNQISPNAAKPDCHQQFRSYIEECDQNPPCGNGSSAGK